MTGTETTNHNRPWTKISVRPSLFKPDRTQ